MGGYATAHEAFAAAGAYDAVRVIGLDQVISLRPPGVYLGPQDPGPPPAWMTAPATIREFDPTYSTSPISDVTITTPNSVAAPFVMASGTLATPPRTGSEALFTARGASIVVNAGTLLANDSMSDGSSLHIGSVGSAVGGTVSIDAQGRIIFTPTPGFSGQGGFDYTVTDGYGNSSTVHAGVQIGASPSQFTAPAGTSWNHGPDVSAPSIATVSGGTVTLSAADLLTSSTDTDGDALAIAGVSNATGGTVTLGDDGVIRFVPDAGFTGTAGFDYLVSDGHGGLTLAHGTVDVVAAPVMAPAPTIAVPVAAPAPVVVTVTAVDNGGGGSSPPDTRVVTSPDQIVQAALGGPAGTLDIVGVSGGGVALDGHGNVLVPPGGASFTITLSDGQGGTIDVPVTLGGSTVPAASEAAGAATDMGNGDDALVGTEDTALVIQAAALLANDGGLPADALEIVAVHTGTGGTVALANGAVTFTPGANYNGTAGFTYDTQDINGTITSHSAAVTVAAVADAPTLAPVALTIAEDSGLATIAAASLAAALGDADGDNVTIDGIGRVVGGTAVLNGDGSLSFTPGANFNGTAAVELLLNDGSGTVTTVLQTIAVTPVNDAPVGADDHYAIAEDQVLQLGVGTLTGNDSDIDRGDLLSVSSVSNAAHGSAMVNADGTVTFTADADYNGSAGFDYVVSDGHGGTATAHATIDIAAVNDAPRGGATLNTDEDTPLTLDLDAIRLGDHDVEGDAFTFGGIAGVRNGQLAQNQDGTYTFTPDANFHGTAGFDYRLTDANGATGLATVAIQVASVNDAPIAIDHAFSIQEDSPLVLNPAVLTSGATDVDFDPLAVAATSNVTGGAISTDSHGNLVFTPTLDFNGTAGFDYTISDGNGGTSVAHATIAIAAVNDAPRSGADVQLVDEDTELVIDPATLLANDYDVEGDSFAMTGVGHASHGTVSIGADNQIHFQADQDFNGTASFDYTVVDANGASSDITVQVQVAPINDAPVTADDQFAINEDQTLTLGNAALTGNDLDVDGDALPVTAVANAVGGSVAIDTNGNVIFTPDADYNTAAGGQAGFDYTVTDAAGVTSTSHVSLDIAAVNDAPRAPLNHVAATEDSPVTFSAADISTGAYDVEGDAVHFVGVDSVAGGAFTDNGDGTYTFTPDANFNGAAQVQYTMEDANGAQSHLIAQIDVAPVNDAPVAHDDSFSVNEDSTLTLTSAALTGNDTDVDNDTLTVTGVSNVGNGSAYVSNGTLVFTPTTNFNGTTTLTYTMTDGHGETSTANVTITVNPVNDTPVINPRTDFGFVFEDNSPASFSASELLWGPGPTTWTPGYPITAPSWDPDGDTLTVTGVYNSYGCTVSMSGGTVTVTSNPNYNGVAGFEFSVTDGTTTVTSHATYDIMPVNDIPIAYNDYTAVFMSQGSLIAGSSLIQNDVDFDGLWSVHIGAVGNASNCNVSTDGVNVGFYPVSPGPASFSYQLMDNAGATSNWATVYVDVIPVTAPIVLDLNGDGIHLTSAQESGVKVDTTGDGHAVSTGWISSGDAFLAFDHSGTGTIQAKDIVLAGDAPGAQTDMEGAQGAYDSNHDGVLDATDAHFADFRLWQDANSDGKVDAGEVHSLADAGIASIGLVAERNDQEVDGNTVHRETTFTRTDGTTGTAADVTLHGVSTTTVVTTTAPTDHAATATDTTIVASADASHPADASGHPAANPANSAPTDGSVAAHVTDPATAATATESAEAATPAGAHPTDTVPVTDAHPAATGAASAEATPAITDHPATGATASSETSATTSSSTSDLDIQASIANQADVMRQMMAAYDPAPPLSTTPQSVDTSAPAPILAANPVADEDHTSKLAA